MTNTRFRGLSVHGLVAAAVLAAIPGVSQAVSLDLITFEPIGGLSNGLPVLPPPPPPPGVPDEDEVVIVDPSGERFDPRGPRPPRGGFPEPGPQGPVVLDQHATIVSASTARCPSYCTDTAYGQTVRTVGESASSLTSFDDRDNGGSGARGRAFAQLTGGLEAPILKAESFGRDGRTGFATAYGIQGYQYEGVDTTLVFNFELTGTLTGGNDTRTRSSEIQSQVALLEVDGFRASTDLSTLVYELGGSFKRDVNGENARKYLTANTPGVVDMTGSIAFNVADGDQFYIWSRLSTQALPGDDADAFNTLVTSFTALDGSTPVGLQSASFLAGQVVPSDDDPLQVAVPTPATFALLLPGLALVVARRARR